jgi:hypothetical protein
MRTPSVILAERPKDIQYNYIRLSENTKLFLLETLLLINFFQKSLKSSTQTLRGIIK